LGALHLQVTQGLRIHERDLYRMCSYVLQLTITINSMSVMYSIHTWKIYGIGVAVHLLQGARCHVPHLLRVTENTTESMNHARKK
jgi:hypothetical protein